MSTAVHAHDGYDTTDVPRIVRTSIILGVFTTIVVLVMAAVTRLVDGPVEAILGGALVAAAVLVFAVLPGRWTNARTIEGIAGAASIGFGSAVVFLLIDVTILLLGDVTGLGSIYTNRWRQIGGGSNWWHHPVWWMLSAYIAWMGALIRANQAARGGVSVAKLAASVLAFTFVCMVIAVLVHVPLAAWSLGTFGVAMIPGLALAAAASAVGRPRV